jgi:hypothetical protein
LRSSASFSKSIAQLIRTADNETSGSFKAASSSSSETKEPWLQDIIREANKEAEKLSRDIQQLSQQLKTANLSRVVYVGQIVRIAQQVLSQQQFIRNCCKQSPVLLENLIVLIQCWNRNIMNSFSLVINSFLEKIYQIALFVLQ